MENRESKDDKMSREVWKAVETEAEEGRKTETEKRRKEGERGKEIGKEGDRKETEKEKTKGRKNNRDKESS